MSPLPLAAFPVTAGSSKSAGFVLAVLVGLTLYMAAQNNKKQS